MTKFAFDLGGVIINKISGTIANDAIMSVKLAVEKFKSNNIYIISKAKDKWIKLNLERLANHNFFELTGLLKDNLYFVNEYEDKEKLCKQLEINYMIDDSIKVLRYLTCKSMLFGSTNEPYNKYGIHYFSENKSNYTISVPTWKHFRKEIMKIK